MNVSREFAIDTIKSVRKTLGDWVRDLEKPMTIDSAGKEIPIYENGVPKGTSVSSVQGIPEDQLRAELLAMSGILESLATSQ